MISRKVLNKKDIKISLIFTILAGFGGLLMGLYNTQVITPEQLGNLTKEGMVAIIAAQSAILYGFILGFLGLKLSRATNLNKGLFSSIYSEKKYNINLKSTILAISFGFINSAVIVLSEKFIFAHLIPELASSSHIFSPLYFLSGLIYGGVVEEIMLRLFLMSLIVFILSKLFANKIDKNFIPQPIYWVSIILSALLFGIGHLPAASLTFLITPVVVTRIVFLNSFAGVLFGYLYWKKGFEYSVISHMFSHVFMQLVFLPIFF